MNFLASDFSTNFVVERCIHAPIIDAIKIKILSCTEPQTNSETAQSNLSSLLSRNDENSVMLRISNRGYFDMVVENVAIEILFF